MEQRVYVVRIHHELRTGKKTTGKTKNAQGGVGLKNGLPLPGRLWGDDSHNGVEQPACCMSSAFTMNFGRGKNNGEHKKNAQGGVGRKNGLPLPGRLG